jgi:biopolymer transport protein ExbD
MRAQYWLRDPSLGLPLLALGINLAVVAWAWWAVRPQTPAPKITILSSSAVQPNSPAVSVEILDSGEVLLDGRRLAQGSSLQAELTNHVDTQAAVIVRVPESLKSGKLVEVLSGCNRAGFTELAISVLVSTETRTLAP